MTRLTNSVLGNTKVIIAPHDAHALRATNDLPCDAYCEKLDGAFLDFYSLQDSRFTPPVINCHKVRMLWEEYLTIL